MSAPDSDSETARAYERRLDAISHELKTPIASLRLSAQLLLRHLEQDSELDPRRSQVLLKAIDHQSEKLGNLVTYLADSSRKSAIADHLEIQDTDVVALVRGVSEAEQALSPSHELVLTAPARLRAGLDPARIEQVLVNLLDNAIKYSPGGGPIHIELAEADGMAIEIAIRDYGRGVPPGSRSRIFDPYSQAHEPDDSGRGLGLYLSRNLVERHGGHLIAEFPPDGGTRLVLRLPSGRTAQPTDAESGVAERSDALPARERRGSLLVG